MMLKKHAAMIVKTAATVVIPAVFILGGCVAGDEPLETAADFVPEPVLDAEALAALAALAAPCESQNEFQVELNGVPDDTAVEKSTVQGQTVTTEMYWYADTRMVVFFRYGEGETWCNVWNESGVVWDR